jgi:hypothetical protein
MCLADPIFIIISSLVFVEIGISFALFLAKIVPEKERRDIRAKNPANRSRET